MKAITQKKYDGFKEEVLAESLLRREVRLKDLKFKTLDLVEYKGLSLGITSKALKKLLGLIGFTLKSTNIMSAQFGEDISIKMLNELNRMVSGQSQHITIFVTKQRQIINVSNGEFSNSGVSYNTYFDTLEKILNDNNVELSNMSFNKHEGLISMEMLPVNDGGESQIGNINDETFRSGMSLNLSHHTPLTVNPFILRLVCANGLITKSFNETHMLKNNSTDSWIELHEHIKNIERNGFVPEIFADTVRTSMNTTASLAELNQGLNVIKNNVKIEDDYLNTFIPFKHTMYTLNKFGINTDDISLDKAKNIRTDVKVWDIINGITDIASHNYVGIEKRNVQSDVNMQVRAGDILTKSYDTLDIVRWQPF